MAFTAAKFAVSAGEETSNGLDQHSFPHAASSPAQTGKNLKMKTVVRLLQVFARLSVMLLIMLAGAWVAGVLVYRLPTDQIFRDALATAAFLGAVFVAWSSWSGKWKPLCAFTVVVCCVGIYWGTITASTSRDWAPEDGRMAWVETAGRTIVHNVRNFEWKSNEEFVERWETREYELSRLKTVDIFLNYWSGRAIAHPILSFGFENAAGNIEQLAFSFELRKRVGQLYSTVSGLFKENELIAIAADERDVIRVRANIRMEDVRQYRLNVTPAEAQALFQDYAKQINELSVTPMFYNTLTTNCTTVVFRMAKELDTSLPYSWRMVLPGYLPEYLYGINAVDTSIALSELKARARINERSMAAADGPDYSRLIRVDQPIPKNIVRR